MLLVDSCWEDGAAVVRWDIVDPRLWNGVLSIPTRAGLQGTWDLRSEGKSWTTTVGGPTLRGGLTIWLKTQQVQYPARLTLRFYPGDRHVDPQIEAHDES